MKRLFILVMFTMMMLGTTIHGIETKLDVRINDQIIAFDSEPLIVDGSTMVPVRTIAEALGAKDIQWDEVKKIVTIETQEKVLIMRIDDTSYINGDEPASMRVAPIISEGRTMVPLRVVAEGFGCDVSWNEAFQTVEITKDDTTVGDIHLSGTQYTYEDALWLARIVNVEGLDISYEAKLAIANVVYNRVKGDEYPDTVEGVIFDDAYAVQFPPAHKESFQTLEPSAESWLAAKNALAGENNIEDCLYFNNRPFQWKSDDLHTVIEGEYFYK